MDGIVTLCLQKGTGLQISSGLKDSLLYGQEITLTLQASSAFLIFGRGGVVAIIVTTPPQTK